jgi:hypothetical protein
MNKTKTVSVFIIKSGLTLFHKTSFSPITPEGKRQIEKAVKNNLLDKKFDLFIHSTEASAITSIQLARSLIIFKENCLIEDSDLKNPKLGMLKWLKKIAKNAVEKNPKKNQLTILATSNSIMGLSGKKIAISPAGIVKFCLTYVNNAFKISEPEIIVD